MDSEKQRRAPPETVRVRNSGDTGSSRKVGKNVTGMLDVCYRWKCELT